MTFFETSTRNLLAYEAAASVGHHVALSVVGSEGLLESGYSVQKSLRRIMIKGSSIPYSIIRATQFFEFVDELVRRGLSARKDPREVVADPHARYYCVELSEGTLVPGDDA
jgi:uncharacterized protein YbjT (DUF2867 family)